MGAIFRDVETEFGRMHESTGKFPYAGGERHHPVWGDVIRDQVFFRQCKFEACDLDITEREYQEERGQ